MASDSAAPDSAAPTGDVASPGASIADQQEAVYRAVQEHRRQAKENFAKLMQTKFDLAGAEVAAPSSSSRQPSARPKP